MRCVILFKRGHIKDIEVSLLLSQAARACSLVLARNWPLTPILYPRRGSTNGWTSRWPTARSLRCPSTPKVRCQFGRFTVLAPLLLIHMEGLQPKAAKLPCTCCRAPQRARPLPAFEARLDQVRLHPQAAGADRHRGQQGVHPLREAPHRALRPDRGSWLLRWAVCQPHCETKFCTEVVCPMTPDSTERLLAPPRQR